MPKVQFHQTDPANFASKLPEKLQWPVGAALGGLKSVFGGDDPSGSVMQTAAPAAPLISIYKDANGVPSAALRKLGTQDFLRSVEDFGNSAVTEAGNWFNQNYPRVAAHMRLSPADSALNMSTVASHPNTLGWAGTGFDEVKNPLEVGITKLGTGIIEAAANPVNRAMGLFAHEGTHVAQSLGNSDYKDLYNGANAIGGYLSNPFEISARNAASKYIDLKHPPPYNAIAQLKKMAQNVGAPLEESARTDAADGVLDILRSRKNSGWSPPPPPVAKVGDLVQLYKPDAPWAKGESVNIQIHTPEHLQQVEDMLKRGYYLRKAVPGAR